MESDIRKTRSLRVLATLTVTVLGLGLAGCGSGDGKKAATQVAVKVNKEEISVHQINFLLSKAGSIPAEKAAEARKQALGRLIDQELLLQKALEAKLDRNPNVMQAIDAARREVLAVAYLEQVTGSAAKPTPDEIKAYYTKHPELFAERKIYRLVEVAISEKPENFAAIRDQIAKGGTLESLLEWLKAQKIPFRPESGVKPAEQLPLDLLPKLHQLKDGQAITVAAPAGLLIVQVQATQRQPVDEKAATQVIENYLLGDKRKQLVSAELKKLKEAAKIEYVGEFAELAAAAPKAAAPVPAAAAAAAPPSPASPPASGDKQPDAEAMAKGLKGIK